MSKKRIIPVPGSAASGRRKNLKSALRSSVFAAVVFLVSAAAAPVVGTAATIYALTEDGSSGGLGSAPYGTVAVTQVDSDLHIFLDVTPNYAITRGAHHALSFTLAESGASVVIDNSGPENDFIFLGESAYTNAPWSGFNYAIDCSVTNGPPDKDRGNCGQTLEFTIVGGGTLLPNGGGDGVFFAADIYSLDTGQTGAVGASIVPLPAAAWLFGSAILGLGVVKRRKVA